MSAAQLVQPGRLCAPGRVVLDGGRIRAAGPAREATEAGTRLTPGFIDLQVNGYGGIDVATCSADELRELGRKLGRTGVTSFLPVLISSPIATMVTQLDRLAGALADWPDDAALPLGFHLEGPFLNPSRRGAHRAADLAAPSRDALVELLEAARGSVRLVTLAPELPGAGALIDLLVGRGVRVAVGHSNATFEEACAAFDRGVTVCTHFGNAMSPLHQRAPGLPAACLLDDRVFLCVIPDLVHVHPALLQLALRAKGAGRVVLVTDTIAAAGLGDGEHHLAGVRVEVTGGTSRDASGALAGSTLCFGDGLARFRAATGTGPLGAALASATNAARALGLAGEAGSLLPGCRADMLEWEEVDTEDRLRRVWLRGTEVAL